MAGFKGEVLVDARDVKPPKRAALGDEHRRVSLVNPETEQRIGCVPILRLTVETREALGL